MISVFVFTFGLAIGSFLNAFIYRLEVHNGFTQNLRGSKNLLRKLFTGRSQCPLCAHALAWHDLIPLLSFVLLQGRCRQCKGKISFQYPLIELATGLLFVTVLWFVLPKLSLVIPTLVSLSFLHVFELFYLWIVVSLLMVIFVYDFKHFLIPDKVIFSAIGMVALWRGFEVWTLNNWDLIGNWKLEIGSFDPLFVATIAGLGASAFFLVIFLVSRGRAMGFGDVKLALFMGLFLSWPNIIVAMSVAFGAGAIVGLALIFFKRKTMRSEVPFGPFLILGTFVALLWGKMLVDFYLLYLGA